MLIFQTLLLVQTHNTSVKCSVWFSLTMGAGARREHINTFEKFIQRRTSQFKFCLFSVFVRKWFSCLLLLWNGMLHLGKHLGSFVRDHCRHF